MWASKKRPHFDWAYLVCALLTCFLKNFRQKAFLTEIVGLHSCGCTFPDRPLSCCQIIQIQFYTTTTSDSSLWLLWNRGLDERNPAAIVRPAVKLLIFRSISIHLSNQLGRYFAWWALFQKNHISAFLLLFSSWSTLFPLFCRWPMLVL